MTTELEQVVVANDKLPQPEKKVSLKVHMARQQSEYFTTPEWPELEMLNKPINYIVRRDGLYEVRKNNVGVFGIQRGKFDAPLPGFPEEKNEEFFAMNYGKIPGELFSEVVAFFKEICDESNDEVYVQTFWDPNEQKYFNHCPKQRVSGASVTYDRDQELERRCVLVLETHSHNTMNAFFSGTDNADEKADRFFGVIGKLNLSKPEMLYSFVCGGKRVYIDQNSIFGPGNSAHDFSSWKENVTRHRDTIKVRAGTRAFDGLDGTNYNFGGGAQRNLWRSESGTDRTTEKEARKEIEKAAREAQMTLDEYIQATTPDDVDVDPLNDLIEEENMRALIADGMEGGAEILPFFRASAQKNNNSNTPADKMLAETITAFKLGKHTMSKFDREQHFTRLVEVLSDEDVSLLSKVMSDFGYTDIMIEQMDLEEEDEVDTSQDASE